jgi:hypothetical protein
MASGTLRLAELNFPEAIKAIMSGKSVTRKEWGNADIFIFLGDGFLMIQKEDGTTHRLIVSEGDMLGIDWYIVD